MAAIGIEDVRRRFGAVAAVDGVSLAIEEGELFTLLGPSGCGKTTLLRMVAGFCDLDEGAIRFGERRIDTLPPHRRNTGMVFQNYAIFPNQTVGGNIAYGLKPRGLPRSEIATRVRRALDLVQLDGFAERWPYQLSGGQLQRVAIARCLVIEPEVLLLDEPLSNLDARLRVEMRRDIRELQKRLGITAVYVTHDQEEALAISDRIAVMRAGHIEQIGRPTELYEHPASPFVAEFLGTTNLLAGMVSGVAGGIARIAVGAAEFVAAGCHGAPGEAVTLSLRPEALRPLGPGEMPQPGWAAVAAQLGRIEFLGALTRVDLALPDGTPLRLAALDRAIVAAGEGAVLTLAYDPARVTVFAAGPHPRADARFPPPLAGEG